MSTWTAKQTHNKINLLSGFNFHAGIWNSISDCTCPVISIAGWRFPAWLQRESYRCRAQNLTSLQCRHNRRDPGWGPVCSCRTEWLALAEHWHNWSILSISLLGPGGSCCPTAKFCLRLGLALWKTWLVYKNTLLKCTICCFSRSRRGANIATFENLYGGNTWQLSWKIAHALLYIDLKTDVRNKLICFQFQFQSLVRSLTTTMTTQLNVFCARFYFTGTTLNSRLRFIENIPI